MTDTIITIAMIQAKARAAFDRGAGRDDHGFNWHSVDAIATWQAEFDRCALKAGQQLVEGCPP
jgi:hypothetical protein